MTTFLELSSQLTKAKNKLCVLTHIMDYIESEFRAHEGKTKQLLLTDEKIPVPDETYDQVTESLIQMIDKINKEIKTINSTEVLPGKG